MVVALAWAAWSARRHRPDDEDDGAVAPDDEQRAAARSVFDASLADLEGEPDPRRAIIAAYARLLDGLDQCGLGRRPAEAPVEHVHRALSALRVPEVPLHTLVDLYAEARFSEHPLTAAHKARAIDAFRAARDDLATVVRHGGTTVVAG